MQGGLRGKAGAADVDQAGCRVVEVRGVVAGGANLIDLHKDPDDPVLILPSESGGPGGSAEGY